MEDYQGVALLLGEQQHRTQHAKHHGSTYPVTAPHLEGPLETQPQSQILNLLPGLGGYRTRPAQQSPSGDQVAADLDEGDGKHTGQP